MDLADFLKNYVVPIGVIITFIGTLFTIYYTRKNTTHTKYIDTVTSERIKWMGKLREYISEYIAIVRLIKGFQIEFNNMSFQERSQKEDEIYDEKTELTREIVALECKIRLLLNPEGERDQKIFNLIHPLTEKYKEVYNPDLTDVDRRNKIKDEYTLIMEKNYKELISEVQLYLKEEWERVKLETQKGYFVKGDDLFEL